MAAVVVADAVVAEVADVVAAEVATFVAVEVSDISVLSGLGVHSRGSDTRAAMIGGEAVGHQGRGFCRGRQLAFDEIECGLIP